MTTAHQSELPSPEVQQLKTHLKATWESGNYAHFATYLEPGALAFLDRVAVQSGERLLDVACGAGQLVIPASRRGIDATGVDIASNLIAQARARAAAGHLNARFDEGDAEALPYPDAAFDVVTSLLGAIFAPRPDVVAAELLRVTRPGGRIVMGNWTRRGFIGQLFGVIGRHVPPPPLMPSPMLWGDEATVEARLGSGAELDTERRMYRLAYPFGPADVVELFRTEYGPLVQAFRTLDDAGQDALRADLDALWQEHNRVTDGTTEVHSEFLEVTALRV
ncbi:class I SAM-dependent methyltransferase [Deinococcus yunweiensis]|uniref:class I SAM-dependent methyltransferase n=1 Tax=Deinococcus yunweiensis TaxID=367282 RepID=UPI00398E9257